MASRLGADMEVAVKVSGALLNSLRATKLPFSPNRSRNFLRKNSSVPMPAMPTFPDGCTQMSPKALAR